MRLGVVLALVALASADAALAQTPVPLTVSGNEASGLVSLPGGYTADLKLSFEQVVGLHPGALDVTASVVDPLDAALLARLPGVAIPAGFPVLLHIEPSSASALSFSGLYTISLHTHHLALSPELPLLLYTADQGGAFRDITRRVGMGSVREDGGGGGFSEFLIVADTRPIQTVVQGKLDRLDAELANHAGSVAAAVLPALQQRLANARGLWQGGNPQGAIAEVDAFSALVKTHSGAAIPDVWRAHDPRPNVAGILRSSADTLRFSLSVSVGVP